MPQSIALPRRLRRVVPPVLLPLLIAACGALPAQAEEVDREKFGPVAASILKVEATMTNGGYSVGTAVAIRPGKFVTSCHVTAKARRVDLLYTGLRFTARRQLADSRHDLCVLDVPQLTEVAPVRVRSTRTLKEGESVAALGFTYGAGLLAQLGGVRALHPLDGSFVIQSATPFSSGASGGGLFDSDGALVGVLTFRLPGVAAYYFSVPSDWLPTELDDAERYTPTGPLQGPVPFWALPLGEQPWFMQAAKLEADRDWKRLLPLTDRWAEAERDNAEPWLTRGHALQQLDRDDDAVDALKTALARNPRLAPAWYELGSLYARRGDKPALRPVIDALRALDANLADELGTRGGLSP